MFNAYTIKKMLPRLIIAVVTVNLSWYIGLALLDVSNVIGGATKEIMLAPFSGLPSDTISSLSGGGQTLVATLMGAFGIGMIFSSYAIFTPILVGGLLALFIGYVVLVIRQAVIVMLLIFSPLVIALWVLPGGEGLAKKGMGLYMKLLMMYPIIIALLVSGRIVSTVLNTTGGSGTLQPTDADVLPKVLALVAVFAPYFMIPFVLKFIGGALGTIAGFANDRSRGVIDGLRKRGAQKSGDNRAKIKSGQRFKTDSDTGIKHRLNRGLQTSALLPSAGLRPRNWRGNIDAARSTIATAGMNKASESDAVRSVIGNDDLLSASLHGTGSESDIRNYLTSGSRAGNYRGADLNQAVAQIKQARKEVGFNEFQDLAAVANAGTGTGYAGGAGEMMDTINRVAGGDRQRASRLLNSARQNAEKARRIDLYGASFGESQGQMNQLHEGLVTQDEASDFIADRGLQGKGASEIATSRTGGLRNMEGSITRRLQRSQAALSAATEGGDAGQIEIARRNHIETLASTDNLLDGAGHASADNATIVGRLLAQETGNTIEAPVYARGADGGVRTTTDRDGRVIPVETGETSSRAETWADQLQSERTGIGGYKRVYGTGNEAASAEGMAGEAIPPPPPPE